MVCLEHHSILVPIRSAIASLSQPSFQRWQARRLLGLECLLLFCHSNSTLRNSVLLHSQLDLVHDIPIQCFSLLLLPFLDICIWCSEGDTFEWENNRDSLLKMAVLGDHLCCSDDLHGSSGILLYSSIAHIPLSEGSDCIEQNRSRHHRWGRP